MEALGKFLIGCCMVAFGALTQGAVFQQMWAWFVESQFNAPVLSLPHAMGLCLMLRWFTRQADMASTSTAGQDFSDAVARWFMFQIGAFAVLGMGYIIHRFM